MEPVTERALGQFWEHVAPKAEPTVSSIFEAVTKTVFDRLSSGKASPEDKRAVTVFLLETGALQIQSQTGWDSSQEQKIVIAEEKEIRDASAGGKKVFAGQKESRGASTGRKKVIAEQQEFRDTSAGSKRVSARQKDSRGASTGRKKGKENGLPVQISDDHDNYYGTGDDGDETFAILPVPSSVATLDIGGQENMKHSSIGERRLPVLRIRKLAIPVERAEKIETNQIKIDIDGDNLSDEDDVSEGGGGGDADSDDDWVPHHDEKAAKEEEAEYETEEPGKREGSSPAKEQNRGEAIVCQTCAGVFYTTWDYDMHSLDCALLPEKSNYKCHVCTRRNREHSSKWGIAYHLISKHNFSGSEALAMVPKLAVKKKMGRRTSEGSDIVTENEGLEEADEEVKGAEESKSCQKDPFGGLVINPGNQGLGEADHEVGHEKIRIEENMEEEYQVVEGREERNNDPPSTTSQEHTTSDFKCKVCLMDFPNRVKLYAHTKTVHFPDNEPFKCSTCGKVFPRRLYFKRHVQTHVDKSTGIKKWGCDQCDKRFNSQGALSNHYVIHTEGAYSHKCKYCDKAFQYKAALNRHIKFKHLMITLPCVLCGKFFHDGYALKSHMLTHTGQRDWKCDQCDKAFFQKTQLNTHKKTAHTAIASFLCDLCGNVYKSQGSLNAHHRDNHVGTKKYLCTHCGKRFSRSIRLREHAKVHLQDWPMRCEICKIGFSFKYQLELHIKMEHEGVQPLSCEVCGKNFLRESYLRSHKAKAHSREVNLFCSECGLGCSDYTQLGKHISKEHKIKLNVHDTVSSESEQKASTSSDACKTLTVEDGKINYSAFQKPYEYRWPHHCDECGKGFHHKLDLKIHVNRHKGIDPFVCKVCNKEFLTEGSLKYHMRTHRKLIPCSECGKGCKSRTELRKHMAKQHNIKIPRYPSSEAYKRTKARKKDTLQTIDATVTSQPTPLPVKVMNEAWHERSDHKPSGVVVDMVALGEFSRQSVFPTQSSENEVAAHAILEMIHQEQRGEDVGCHHHHNV